MATNFKTSTQGGQREDLANYISNISRDMTPFLSSIGKGKATSITHSWSTDTLQTAGPNSQTEGSTFAASASPTVQKLTNDTQIFTKGIQVSGTLESVDKAGRTEKRGKEMMRDLEFALVSSQVKGTASAAAVTAGHTSGAVLMGGYQSFCTTSGAVAATGTLDATKGTGNGTNVPAITGSTTAGAFSLDDINSVLEAINGETSAAPSKVMMSTANKVKFSDMVNTGTGTNVRRNIDDKGALRQSVDMYESDFGDVEIVHNYLMGDSEVFIYDPSLMSVNTLRPAHLRNINEDGDSLRSYMVQEVTFEAKSPTGNGIIVNVA